MGLGIGGGDRLVRIILYFSLFLLLTSQLDKEMQASKLK
jgi:hypothetical protein